MGNELDFRVGDVVCDFVHGTGKIDNINSFDKYSIKVDYGIDVLISYTIEGSRFNTNESKRFLYHGTWEEVFGNLPDLKPKRKVKRWVNLYCRENQIIAGHAYPRPEEAKAVCDASLIAKAVEIEVDE